jgi:hypothetical protein
MAIKKRNKPIPDYKDLFNHLPRKQFLGSIFLRSSFIIRMATRFNMNPLPLTKNFNQLFNYYHEDDLYQFFKINHSLHKDKSKYDYLFTLYLLIADLYRDIPSDEFVEYKYNIQAKPEYVYYSNTYPELSNIARDFFEYGFHRGEIKERYGVDFITFQKRILGVYQEGLLPLDITLQSYY